MKYIPASEVEKIRKVLMARDAPFMASMLDVALATAVELPETPRQRAIGWMCGVRGFYSACDPAVPGAFRVYARPVPDDKLREAFIALSEEYDRDANNKAIDASDRAWSRSISDRIAEVIDDRDRAALRKEGA